MASVSFPRYWRRRRHKRLAKRHSPMSRFASGLGSRAHGHQTGQFLVFTARPYTARTPNWDGWVEGAPGIEHHHGTRVLWNVRVHGVDRNVIHALSGLRKDVTHPLATPAIAKPKEKAEVRLVFRSVFRLTISGRSPACLAKWFVIQGVHLGRASGMNN